MKNTLEQYQPICVAIGRLFPNHVEVILHDLLTEKIAYIENAFSHRVIGDDSLIDVKALHNETENVIGPYSRINSDGKTLKSVSVIIKNDKNKPVALMCMNFQIEEIDAAIALLKSFTDLSTQQQTSDSLMSEDWREKVNVLMRKTLHIQQTTLVMAKRQDKIAILKSLDEAQIFAIRGSSNYVANALGISRANFYEILRDARKIHINN